MLDIDDKTEQGEFDNFIKLVADEKPYSAARARFTRNRHRGAVYNPVANKYRNTRLIFTNQLEELGLHDFPIWPQHCVSAYIEFNFAIPKSWKKSKKKEALIGKWDSSIRNDIDNLIKAPLDVCNGIIYKDDRQVTQVSATKNYVEGESSTVIVFQKRGSIWTA